MKIIKRGAEAIIYLDDSHLVKERVKKNYRLAQIDDRLRKLRIRKEARLLSEAKRAGVETPNMFSVDENEFKITMEFIDGKRLKEFLNETDDDNRDKTTEMILFLSG